MMIASLVMPPEQYDFVPKHIPKIMDFNRTLIEAVCHIKHRDNATILGCYLGDTIYLRDDLSSKARAKVLRHEYGHVNGWVHK